MNTITNPVELELDAYLQLFDPSTHAAIRASLQRDGVEAAVCYEVLDLCSSQRGHRTSMICGPGCSYTLGEALAHHLGDVPSRFAYPVFYTRVVSQEA